MKLAVTYNKYFLGFVLGLSCTAQVFAQTINLQIKPNETHQTIDGFGASDAWRCQFVGQNWPLQKRNQIAEWLFSKEMDTKGNPKGIGLSIWRFYIGAGTAEQGEASGIKEDWRRGESFLDAEGNYNWNKQAGQQWFLQKAKEAGVNRFLAFSIAPPTFWSLNGKGYGYTTAIRLNLKEEHYDDYARFMVDVVDHFEKEGIHFNYLSPINEPQWDWEKASQEGTPASNEDIARLVKSLNGGLTKRKLQTEIVVGEAADLRYLYSEYGKPGRAKQVNAFYNRDSDTRKSYIRDLEKVSNTVSGHSYFTTSPVDSLVSIRQELQRSLEKSKLDYWQSEFCILENSEDLGGGGGTRDFGMNTALYVARVIHADLTLANARSWQWWTALTNADYKDGLIYLDTGNPEDMYNLESMKYDGQCHDSKLLWALGNYSRFVKPGMQRVSCSYSTDKNIVEQFRDLMVSAYINEQGEVTIVLINYTDKSKEIIVDQKDISLKDAYETSSGKELERRKVRKNRLQIAPRSVTTLTGEINVKTR